MGKQKPKPTLTPALNVSEEEHQRRHTRFIFVAGGIVNVLKWLIWGAVIVASFYVTFALPVLASHGETTTITVAQNWVANVNAQVWVSWGLAAGATGYGLNERRLRRKERAEKDARIKKLEEAKDPSRTSSGVDQKGEPKKGTEP